VSALCLVPSPLAAERAARRLCDAQGGILFGPMVSTFDRLVAAVLAAAADRRPILTPLAERLLAVEAGQAAAAEERAGHPLAALTPESGLAASLCSALRELRRAGVTAEDVRGAAAALSGAPQAAARLATLGRALAAFEALLEDLGVHDAAAAVRAAGGAVARGAALPEAAGADLLVLDGFTALSPAEWELVTALAARAGRTRVHLPFTPDRPDLCAPAEPLLRRLEGLHELAARRDIEVALWHLDEPGRSPASGALLSAFARGVGAPPGVGAAAPPGIRCAAGAGEGGEAELAAALVLELVEEGFAPEDIVLVAPSPRRAAAALRAPFAERGLPLSTGRGAALAEVPVVRLVLDAAAAAGRLEGGAAARLLGSSWLAPLGAPGLRAALERAGALDGRGRAAAALRRRAEGLDPHVRERRALQRAAEKVEGLEAALAPLARPGTARTHAARLAAVVEGLGLRRRAARGPRALAAADLAALDRLEEAADDVVQAVALCGRGGEELPPEEFQGLLGQAVLAAALPPPAEAAAGAVVLHGLDEVVPPARAAVLLGCVEGRLPPAPAADPLFRDPERLALNRHLGRAAVAVAAARRADALHRAFHAAAAGRERVAFLWPAPGPGGDGGPLASLAVEALAAVGVAPPAAPAPEPTLGAARTARAALRAAARLGRAALPALPPALAARAGDALARGEIEAERQAAVLAEAAAPHAGGLAGRAAELLRERLPEEWTPSQLEAYARCPFRAFTRLALRLPDDAEPDLEIDGREEGILLHAILERFAADRVARGAWPPRGTAEELAEVRQLAEGVLQRFEREGKTGDPAVWAGKREAILHRLDRIVRAEVREHDGLSPRLLEHAFGGGAEAPALSLSAEGEEVRLRGRIDRVDADPGRLLVIDYKNARSGEAYEALLAPEAFGVQSFQIPAYLMAASRALPGRRAEATFALLRRAERLPPVGFDPGEPLLAPWVPGQAPGELALRSPAADGEGPGGGAEQPVPFAAAVVRLVRRVRAGEFPIVSQGCDHCPHGAVCRFEGVAARAAEEGR
jgi:hypothetical protein